MSELSNFEVEVYDWGPEKEDDPDDLYGLCFRGRLSDGKIYYLVVLHKDSGKFCSGNLLSQFDDVEQSFNLWFRERDDSFTKKVISRFFA